MMDDAERFRGCLSLSAVCRACGEVRHCSEAQPPQLCGVPLFHFLTRCVCCLCNQECEVKSVQLAGEPGSTKKVGLNCDFCGSQYFGRQ